MSAVAWRNLRVDLARPAAAEFGAWNSWDSRIYQDVFWFFDIGEKATAATAGWWTIAKGRDNVWFPSDFFFPLGHFSFEPKK